MSETVHYTGRLKLVEKLENETLEEQCKRILKWHKYTELNKYCDTWEEMLCDEFYKKYVIYNEDIYEVVELKDRCNRDVFEAIENSDGSISYVVMYYNGGCSFDEAIGYALDKL